ncbi:hypothetical protein M422DRAFT_272795 [Sphaerobolus stellatus SS14]|uniref:Unplaced genomic scaffold SPHSTscaffold_306, whole genome shotgun sequence n=1 Tax=Sphaerobolus stellatus (strain SS14) TaxID=990650 RepID=A0A0C9TAM8_SPHS4|nr:hypothetical protein M422DRAFT_272795 [Sphaerobolus stellatus SS14]
MISFKHTCEEMDTHTDQKWYVLIASRSLTFIQGSVAVVQERKVKENDSTLQNSYTELSKPQDDTTKQISTLKRAMEKGTTTKPTIKRLQTVENKYEDEDTYSTLSTLEYHSSGRIQAPELIEPSKYSLHTFSKHHRLGSQCSFTVHLTALFRFFLHLSNLLDLTKHIQALQLLFNSSICTIHMSPFVPMDIQWLLQPAQ